MRICKKKHTLKGSQCKMQRPRGKPEALVPPPPCRPATPTTPLFSRHPTPLMAYILDALSVRSGCRCPRIFGVPTSGSSALREPSGDSTRGGRGGCARACTRVRLHGRGGGAARVPFARLQVCRRCLLVAGDEGRAGKRMLKLFVFLYPQPDEQENTG